MTEPKVRRCFVDGEYGQLHLRQAGAVSDKPTIICLHMVPKSGRSFANIMPYLASERLVLAIDYPGYGESAPPPLAPTVEDYARAVWQVVDGLQSQADLKTVSFVGYHTGSMVAVEATIQRPHPVDKLINVSAPIFTAAEVDNYHKQFAPVPLDEEGRRFKMMWERIMQHRGPGMTLEMAADSMAENLRGGENYEWGHSAAFNYAATYNRHLAELDKPVFIMNINDSIQEHSRRIDPNNGYRKEYPQWGTGLFDAFPKEIAAEILSFLDDA